MNQKKLSIYSFVNQVFIIFGITILILTAITAFGVESKEFYSSLFQLGKAGLATSTIFQILGSSFILTCITNFFFSERIIKEMMLLWRTIFMLVTIIITIAIFIIIFNWFPINLLPAWISFFVSFGICFTVSTVVMVRKTKQETKEYEALLAECKMKHSDEIENKEG